MSYVIPAVKASAGTDKNVNTSAAYLQNASNSIVGLFIVPDFRLPVTSTEPTFLQIVARFADGSELDVTQSGLANLSVSSPKVLRIEDSRLVAAVGSGVAIVQATYDGAVAMRLVDVQLGSDSDGDGIPDDAERASSLDPADASDAVADLDRDGLANIDEYRLGTDIQRSDSDGDGLKDGEEVARGTNPLLADTDGDLIPDGLEVQLGTNPLDRTSVNLSGAIERLEVTPAAAALIVNTLSPEASIQLRVNAVLRDGSRLDLASSSRGTRYSSSNLTVCNFGARDGQVFAGEPSETAPIPGSSPARLSFR